MVLSNFQAVPNTKRIAAMTFLPFVTAFTGLRRSSGSASLRSFSLMLILVFTAWAGPLAAKTKSKKLNKEIETTFNKFAPTGMAVAIIQNGEVVLKTAYGYKDAESKTPLNENSLFNIASCSKAFTAACIAMLVADGKIGWKDKVVDYVPGFQLADPCISNEMTIRDLLCHRSGLATFYGDLLWYGTDYSNEEIISRMRYLPILREFRSEFGYQNNMYMVAGEVIRRVTGKTWSEFLSQRIFKPLSMTSSRPSNDELESGQDIAYGHINGEKQGVYDFNGTKPAASIYSSVDELTHWMQMLLDKGKYGGQQVLTEHVINQMFAAHTAQNVSGAWKSWGVHFRAYGLGWGMWDYAGRKVVEHNGGMPGYISKVCLVPEENLGIVILNNGMDGLVNDVVRFKMLDQLLDHDGQDWDKVFGNFKKMGEQFGEQAKQERISSQVKRTKMSVKLDDYAGDYEDKMYGKATVRMQGSDLKLTLVPSARIFSGTMEHWHYDTFKVQFNDPFLTYALITFDFNSSGKVSGFKIDLPNDDFHFENLDFRRQG